MTGRFLRTPSGRLAGGPTAGVWVGLLLLAGWLCWAAPARAQQVRAYVSTDSITVGDRFRLALVATHDLPTDPVFPAVSTTDTLAAFGDLAVLGQEARRSYQRGGLRVDSVVYEVTTFAVDSAFVPPLDVLFTADEDTFSAASQPLVIDVVSLVPPDARELRDFAPLVPFPAVIWPWVLLAVVVLLVAALLAYYYLRRRRQAPPPPAAAPAPPPLSPYDEATRRLRALETADLASFDAVKPFYVELSDTLRTYLARRLHVNALERTTRELIFDLERRSPLADDHLRRLRMLLEQADLVKYADARPAAERSRATLDETQATLHEIERALHAAVPREPEPAVPS